MKRSGLRGRGALVALLFVVSLGGVAGRLRGADGSSRRRLLGGHGHIGSLELDGTFCQDANVNMHRHVYIRDRQASTMCMPGMFKYRRELDAMARSTPRHRNADMANFEAALREMYTRRGFEKASRAFQDVMYLEAQDVFATRETWSDEDTEILRWLDNRPNAWVVGELTTENVKVLLPSLQDLLNLTATKSIAVVGSGPSIRGRRLGKEIDQHPEVVRFNDHPVVVEDTGSKTTMLVVNRWVDEGIRYHKMPLFDLEGTGTLDSYCFRMNRFGRFHRMPRGVPGEKGPTFLIRPSARCAMRTDIGGFTRGFLFYWVFGSLYEDADLYGFGSGSGRGHIGPGRKSPVAEPFLDFEHALYQRLHDMQKKKRRLALAARRMGNATRAAAKNATRAP